MKESQSTVLLVEDNPGDVRLITEGMKEGRIQKSLCVAHDGYEALAFLRQEPPFSDAPRPDLILLDLQLPGISGHEVLAEIKTDPQFKRIPVIVFTSSEAESDVIRAYSHHANSYVPKPLHLVQLFQVIEAIEAYWFNVVKLPPK